MDGAMIDDLAELMRPDALCEMKQATHDIAADELTVVEVICQFRSKTEQVVPVEE
jgi:hypothetical protein